MNCSFCQKTCLSKRSLSHHERTCPDNPDRKYKNGMLGKKAWNQGLKKEDHASLASMAEKNSAIMKQKLRDGISSPFSKEWWSEERKKQVSVEKKTLFQQSPEKHPNRILSKNKSKMSYPEQVAFNWLVSNNVSFESQVKVENYFADFIVDNLIIEIDGERWHPEGNEKDKIRDEKLKSLGYDVIRIRSKENIEERLNKIFGE